ncbi:MAG: type II toxin-antitoxin system VapC family toxin [Planctomycetota bacterium]
MSSAHLLDVNILIYLHLVDLPQHKPTGLWLKKLLANNGRIAVSSMAFSGFVRIVTNPKSFVVPTKLEDAFEFVDDLRQSGYCDACEPGERHWGIFQDLCVAHRIVGPDITDAYFAALAMESGAIWVSTDADFKRYPGLRWINPLAVTS